jgi:UDP-glucose 4-epimerase
VTKSIVTGAAGFVGSHLTESLLQQGHTVVAIDCFTDYYDRARKVRNLAGARAHASFELIEADLCEIDLSTILDGASCVFHLAGQAGVRPSWGGQFGEYVRNNISATQRLLEAVKGRPIKIVFASSSSVYGDAEALPARETALPCPVSPYGVTKLAAEHLCSLYGKLYGLSITSLRLFTVYGPRQRPDMAIQRFLSAALLNEPITVFGDGEQTRDFTFAGDVVRAHELAARGDAPGVYNICGGSRISIRDLLSLIETTTGRSLRIDYQPPARGDARHTFGDYTSASKHLGYQPATSLADGIAAQWSWLVAQGATTG